MKKLLLIVCLLLAGMTVQAQTLDEIFAECKEAKGAMNLNLTKDMLKMAMAMQKDQAQSDIAKKIDNMKLVIIPSPDSLFAVKVQQELEALEKKETDDKSTEKNPDGYTKVMTGGAKDTALLVLIKAEGEDTDYPIIREFVIGALAKENGQQALIVAQVLGRFNVDDMEALMHIVK